MTAEGPVSYEEFTVVTAVISKILFRSFVISCKLLVAVNLLAVTLMLE